MPHLVKPASRPAVRSVDIIDPADRVWFNTERAAAYLDFEGENAVHNFREFARRRKDVLVPRFRGRRPLYHRADLDRVIGETKQVDRLRVVR